MQPNDVMQKKLNLLIHCKFDLIRKGIEKQLNELSFDVRITYADLLLPGILRKIRQYRCHFIMVLPTEPDDDFMLCHKLKTFAPDIPVIFISSVIPEAYKKQLETLGIEIILPLPLNTKELDEQVKEITEETPQTSKGAF